MDYTIYILAQGQSSRMGKDKGMVKINGIEMVAHCIENLKPHQQEIVLVTSNPAYEKFGSRIISDNIKNQGPAQGIITALEDSRMEKNLIVSCDMPLINDLMIRQFHDQPVGQAGLINNSDIVCFEEEFIYPFPGFYSKSILPKWKGVMEKGNYKMQSLIKQFNYKSLPIDDPELFLNVNTPADVKTAEDKLR